MPKTVLLVEDIVDIRSFIKFRLERKGYEVIEAENGYDAVNIASQQTPDIILMDMALPHVDGLTATQTIRKLNGYHQVPIIAVTAYGDYYFSRAMEAGCNGILIKPLDLDQLDILLNHYLSQ